MAFPYNYNLTFIHLSLTVVRLSASIIGTNLYWLPPLYPLSSDGCCSQFLLGLHFPHSDLLVTIFTSHVLFLRHHPMLG